MKSTWQNEAIIWRSGRREFRDKDSSGIAIGKLSVLGTLPMILLSRLSSILKQGIVDDVGYILFLTLEATLMMDICSIFLIAWGERKTQGK